MSPSRKVYLTEERIYADLVSEGTYASRVQYTFGGVFYDVFVENDEYVIIQDDDELEWEELE
jgi:hypothetical protein